NVSDEELIHQLRTQGLYISIAGVQDRQVKVAVEAPDGVRILREEHVTLIDRANP
nr:carbon storage regulator [Pseudomonas aeruginosa]